MKISMEILEYFLGKNVTNVRKKTGYGDFSLEKWHIGPAKGSNVTNSELFVMDAETVGKKVFSPLSRVICAGTPDDLPSCSILCTDLSILELAECINGIFEQFADLERKLLRAVFPDSDTDGILEAVAPFFGNRLILCSFDFRVLSRPEGDRFFSDSMLPEPQKDGTLPLEMVTDLKNDPLFAENSGEKEVFSVEPQCTGNKILCRNIVSHGVPSCRLMAALVPGEERPFDAALLELAAGYLETGFQSADFEAARPRERLEDAALRILSGENVSRETMEMALQFRGWSVADPFFCACLLPSETTAHSHTAPYYCRILAGELSDVFVFSYEDHILLIGNLRRCQGKIAGFMEKSVEFLRDNHILAGFSGEFTNMAELGFRWKQARIALSEGLRTRPTLWYHYFRDYALSYMVHRAEEELPGKYLEAPELCALSAYDRDNGTEYVKTLRTYLEVNLNTVQAAKKLYISRGTMIYRIRRIGELTGLSLTRPDTRLYVELSYLIRGGKPVF